MNEHDSEDGSVRTQGHGHSALAINPVPLPIPPLCPLGALCFNLFRFRQGPLRPCG